MGRYAPRYQRPLHASTYGLQGEHKAIDIHLQDLMPLPAPAAGNNAEVSRSLFDRTTTKGDDYFDGVTPENASEQIAQYALSPQIAAMRSKMTEDMQFDTHRVSHQRRSHRQDGQRIGDFTEYERFRRGKVTEQHFWETREREERPHRGTLVVHVNTALLAGERAADLEWPGAVAAALTDLLEELGYRVVLRAAHTNRGNSKILDVTVTLKEDSERLSEFALAYMCHGGIYRVLTFSTRLAQTDVIVNYGLGASDDYKGEQVADIVVPRDVRTEQAAVDFINETLSKYKGDQDAS